MNAEKIRLINKLKSVNQTNIQSFVLSNPLKLSTDLLIWAANYLHFKAKIKDKIPAWSSIDTLEPLPAVSIEQSSSQLTAEFKAKLIGGRSCLDLTGGMGIDSYFFAQQFQEVTYVEQRADLVKVATHNFEELGVNNITAINQKAEEYLTNTEQRFDLIYLDPARRDEHGGKVFFIPDCSPDVTAILPNLLSKTSNILIKYAPMLDIKAAISALTSVYKVLIVAVDNDVKEVLYWIRETSKEPIIEAINLSKENQPVFQATATIESETQLDFHSPQAYLYEPNAAILKAGMFKAMAKSFHVNKLAQNTHLYTNEALVINFPGRRFRITKTERFNKKKLRRELNGQYANVSCRNFPLKPDALKKLLGYQDGGEDYIFFTQNQLNEKIVIFTTKISDQTTTLKSKL